MNSILIVLLMFGFLGMGSMDYGYDGGSIEYTCLTEDYTSLIPNSTGYIVACWIHEDCNSIFTNNKTICHVIGMHRDDIEK